MVNRILLKGGWHTPIMLFMKQQKGGVTMTIYEALSLALQVGMFMIMVIESKTKRNHL